MKYLPLALSSLLLTASTCNKTLISFSLSIQDCTENHEIILDGAVVTINDEPYYSDYKGLLSIQVTEALPSYIEVYYPGYESQKIYDIKDGDHFNICLNKQP